MAKISVEIVMNRHKLHLKTGFSRDYMIGESLKLDFRIFIPLDIGQPFIDKVKKMWHFVSFKITMDM